MYYFKIKRGQKGIYRDIEIGKKYSYACTWLILNSAHGSGDGQKILKNKLKLIFNCGCVFLGTHSWLIHNFSKSWDDFRVFLGPTNQS